MEFNNVSFIFCFKSYPQAESYPQYPQILNKKRNLVKKNVLLIKERLKIWGIDNNMDIEVYRKLILDTVINEYPTYLKKKLLTNLVSRGSVSLRKYTEEDQKNNVLDLSPYPDIKIKLTVAIAQRDDVLKEVEYFELLKGYRYSCMFDYTGDIEASINSQLDSGRILKLNTNFENESISNTINKPVVYINEDKIVLKFNLHKTANSETGKYEMKYPVIVTFSLKYNVVEVRFDTLKTLYKNSSNYYEELIKEIKMWIQNYLKISIDNIDFKQVEKYIEKNKDDVIIYAQSLRTNSGSKIVLDINADEECIMPILGSLKNLIKENEDDFNKAPAIKILLDDFIDEIKETSDSEWFKLYWKQESDSEGILISIYHVYHSENYSLIQYHNNLKDMEMMDYVTEYLSNCREEIGRRDEIN